MEGDIAALQLFGDFPRPLWEDINNFNWILFIRPYRCKSTILNEELEKNFRLFSARKTFNRSKSKNYSVLQLKLSSLILLWKKYFFYTWYIYILFKKYVSLNSFSISFKPIIFFYFVTNVVFAYFRHRQKVKTDLSWPC